MSEIETICAHSYRNFHAKGLDYLCLHRSPDVTIKAYFFDGDVTQLPEIVVPHNHRYAFTTQVLDGLIVNRIYRPSPRGVLYDQFDYLTPLNGGNGFSWAKETRLHECDSAAYSAGQWYSSSREILHTLSIKSHSAIAVLTQFADEIPTDIPTQAFRVAGSREAPSLDGLYEAMTPDHARSLLRRLSRLGWDSHKSSTTLRSPAHD